MVVDIRVDRIVSVAEFIAQLLGHRIFYFYFWLTFLNLLKRRERISTDLT